MTDPIPGHGIGKLDPLFFRPDRGVVFDFAGILYAVHTGLELGQLDPVNVLVQALFEVCRVPEERNVDRREELIGKLAGLGIRLGVHVLGERPAGQETGEDFDAEGNTVTFVGGHGDHGAEFGEIVGRLSVFVQEPAHGDLHALLCHHDGPALGGNAASLVNGGFLVFFPVEPNAEGVVAYHRIDAAPLGIYQQGGDAQRVFRFEPGFLKNPAAQI